MRDAALLLYFATASLVLGHWVWTSCSLERVPLDEGAVDAAIEAAGAAAASARLLAVGVDAAAFSADCSIAIRDLASAVAVEGRARRYDGGAVAAELLVPAPASPDLLLTLAADQGAESGGDVRIETGDGGGLVVWAPCTAEAGGSALTAAFDRVAGPGLDSVLSAARHRELINATAVEVRVALLDAEESGPPLVWEDLPSLRAAAVALQRSLSAIMPANVSIRVARSPLRRFQGGADSALRPRENGAVPAADLAALLPDHTWDADPLLRRTPSHRVLHLAVPASAPRGASGAHLVAASGRVDWTAVPEWGCAAVATASRDEPSGAQRVRGPELRRAWAALLACARRHLALPPSLSPWEAAARADRRRDPALSPPIALAAAAPTAVAPVSPAELALVAHARAAAMAECAAASLAVLRAELGASSLVALPARPSARAEAAAALVHAARAASLGGDTRRADALTGRACEEGTSARADGLLLPLSQFPQHFLYAVYLPFLAPLIGPAYHTLRLHVAPLLRGGKGGGAQLAAAGAG